MSNDDELRCNDTRGTSRKPVFTYISTKRNKFLIDSELQLKNDAFDEMIIRKFYKKISNLYGFIYLATNKRNNKVYIGQTALPRTIEKEWNRYISLGSKIKKQRLENPEQKIKSSHLVYAIAKYGKEAWKLELIDIAFDKNELDEKENNWIKTYDSMNSEKGYNKKEGGSHGKPSSETKAKMRAIWTEERRKWWSALKKNLLNNPSVRREMSDRMKEFFVSYPEQRELISKATKEAMEKPEIRKKISDAINLIWKDPIFQKKQSEARAKLWKDPIYREKATKSITEAWQDLDLRKMISEKMKEIFKEPAIRKKISEATKKAIHVPEVEARILNNLREAMQRPEVRKKLSATAYRLWQDEEYRKKQSESRSKAMAEKWKDPEFRRKQMEIKQSPEFRKKVSESVKKAMKEKENKTDNDSN